MVLDPNELPNGRNLKYSQKNSKTPFFGEYFKFLPLGLKPPQKDFFENMSTNVAVRGFQSFSIKEGAAVVPSEQ